MQISPHLQPLFVRSTCLRRRHCQMFFPSTQIETTIRRARSTRRRRRHGEQAVWPSVQQHGYQIVCAVRADGRFEKCRRHCGQFWKLRFGNACGYRIRVFWGLFVCPPVPRAVQIRVRGACVRRLFQTRVRGWTRALVPRFFCVTVFCVHHRRRPARTCRTSSD